MEHCLIAEGPARRRQPFIIAFGIVEGREDAAATALIQLLNDGHEVSLCNDLDEGGEGSTSFCRKGGGYEQQVGGHGWSGEPTPMDEAAVRAAIVALAPLNRGSHWSEQGSITWRKYRVR